MLLNGEFLDILVRCDQWIPLCSCYVKTLSGLKICIFIYIVWKDNLLIHLKLEGTMILCLPTSLSIKNDPTGCPWAHFHPVKMCKECHKELVQASKYRCSSAARTGMLEVLWGELVFYWDCAQAIPPRPPLPSIHSAWLHRSQIMSY